jgi:hypothetical protein
MLRKILTWLLVAAALTAGILGLFVWRSVRTLRDMEIGEIKPAKQKGWSLQR